MRFFHGTKEGDIKITACGRYATCFTDDEVIAAEYAEYNTNGGGFVEDECFDEDRVRVYTVDIGIAEDDIATVEDIEEITGEAIEFGGPATWEVIDDVDVQDAIAEAGFKAVRFDDEAPTGTEHETVRIVDDAVEAKIEDVEILEKVW